MNITFNNPQYLSLLFLIPVIILIHLITLRTSKRKALIFANFEAISRVKGVDILSKNIGILVLTIVIVSLLSFVAAGTVLHRQVSTSSFSFIVAIDASRSMEATDVSPSRLEVAKATSLEFIDQLPDTSKAGLVSFSGNTYIEQDLTRNKELLRSATSEVRRNPIEGTDVYELVVTSTNLMIKEEGKAIILMSDGQMNIGKLEEAIAYANENDVVIDTIAIGTKAGGQTSFGLSKLDEDTLKSLAYNTGGNYFNAQNKAELSDYFKNIIKLTNRKVSTDLTMYLSILVISLFVIQYFLINTRYKTFP